MKGVIIPKEISIEEIRSNKLSLSPLQYKRFEIKNKNVFSLKELLDRKLKSSDKGFEVGSQNYISKSPYQFVRTKSLQPDYYLPSFSSENTVPILPSCFKSSNLKKGDILISKDSNIGEMVILNNDFPNMMISGGIYKLPLSNLKLYVLAFFKDDFIREQLNFKTSKSATIRHAKTLFLDCEIPFPNQSNKKEVINFVEMLVESIINKEIEIQNKSKCIQVLIDNELSTNQRTKHFKYELPTFQDLNKLNRINAGIYSEYFKNHEFQIKNYKGGFNNIEELGFKINRGQNLQVSAIGESKYSIEYKSNFYTVILPKNLTEFGTVKEYLYLGNLSKLKTLKEGDIIFGAEGFEKGRSLVIFKDMDRTITNIHGITLSHLKGNIKLSIFIKCFLDYLRNKQMIDLYAVGGNGGSLAQTYWKVIPFPLFPNKIQENISKLYFQPLAPSIYDFNNFVEIDSIWNKEAGIIQLDQMVKIMKYQLKLIIDKIILNNKIEINFDFFN